MFFSTILSVAAFSSTALAGYALQDDYMSKDFYSNFDFFTAADPTNGFVKYVDQSTAQSMGLMNTTAKASWGVDTKNKDAAGRASIRLTSKKTYNKGLMVIDVQHMPFGCGTWPAYWMVGPNWPSSGEIDILEGVNEQTTNAFTLHTGTGCSVGKDTSIFTSKVKTSNCDVKASGQDNNAGCGLTSTDTRSYGAGLNNNGGGVFATEWTDDYIQIFFFPRGSVPSDALGSAPSPSTWGKPAAKWDNTGCNIDKFFKNQQIVFDTTFCGDWAGATWNTSTCASKAATCNAYVQNNPQAFTNAYWNINSLKVYQNGSTGTPASSAVATSAATLKPTTSVVTSKVSTNPGVPATSSKLTVRTSKVSTKPGVPVVSSKLASSSKPGLPVTKPVLAVDTSASSNKPAATGQANGNMGGFQWPTASGKPASPSGSSASPGAAKPTSTGTSTSQAFVKDVQASPSPSQSSKPDGNDNVQVVWETVRKTVVVTWSPPAAAAATPAHKRNDGLHKRRQDRAA